MINIHVYPSPFTYESRILRETSSLREFNFFDRIDLVGVGTPDLPEVESIASGLQLRRLGRRVDDPDTTLRKLASAITWGFLVFRSYRRQQLACINCHSVTALPVCVLLKRVSGAKLVYDTHELETETNGLDGARKYLTKLVEGWLIKHVDYSIFVGRAIRDWYVQHYGLEHTAVIYNCPRRGTFEPSDHFRERFGISSSTPVFLYQGVLGSGRGIEALVEAFAELRGEAVLVLMGYGPLADWVEAQGGRLPGVFYHGAVAPEQLLAYTAAADYGISVIEPTSLSYEYCMPNKLFEYLMAGKPVLVSPTTEQRDFVERLGVGVVANDTSPDSIREAVHELLAMDSLDLAESVARAKAEFDWEGQETTLRKVYEMLGFHPRQVAQA